MKRFILLLCTLCVCFALQAVEYTILSETRGTAFKTYVVEYTSVAADGVTPAQVSGVVTVPKILGLGNPDVLVIDNHHTVCDNASVPSVMGGTMSCIGAGGLGLGALYPMAAPDYYGYGISRDQIHPYLAQEQNARNSLDLIPVAQDILASKHDLHPQMLYNIGYSQGGGVALAVHKLFETDAQYSDLNDSFSLGIHTACGDGPYSPVVSGKFMYEQTEKVLLPALLPLIINGYLCSAPAEDTENLTLADFFQPELLVASTLTDPVTGRTMDYPGLEVLMASKEYGNESVGNAMVLACGGKQGIGDFFTADMMNFESDLYLHFSNWLSENDLTSGWQPLGEVQLYHLIEDDIVAVENTYVAAESLAIPSERVHLFSADNLGIKGEDKHSKFAVTFFLLMVDAITHSYTSLDAVESVLDPAAPCYDLQGNLVGLDYHGIVIQRGNKYMK